MKKEEGKLQKKFNLRAKPGQVIPYSQADDGLRDRMRVVMTPIDTAPHSFDALVNYGARPMAKFGRSSTRLLGVQKQLSDKVKDMNKALDNLDVDMKGIDIDGLSANIKTMLKSMTDIKAPAATPAAEDAFIAQVVKTVPAVLEKLEQLEITCEKFGQDIDVIMKEASRVSRQRRDAAREMGIHIGTGEKLIGEYEAGYLVKACKKFEKNQSPENRERLAVILERGDNFKDQMNILQHSREQTFSARKHMRQIVDTMKQQRAIFANVAKTSATEWKAMLRITGGFKGASLPPSP